MSANGHLSRRGTSATSDQNKDVTETHEAADHQISYTIEIPDLPAEFDDMARGQYQLGDDISQPMHNLDIQDVNQNNNESLNIDSNGNLNAFKISSSSGTKNNQFLPPALSYHTNENTASPEELKTPQIDNAQNEFQTPEDNQLRRQTIGEHINTPNQDSTAATPNYPVFLEKTKATANYSLNIMVRQFTKHAERKLNLCLNSVPLDQEPNIIDLLSEGVDPTFDKIIASLGYIARKKPKSVTDAVMHWRRGKSELREMARSILQKDLQNGQLARQKSTSHLRKTSSKIPKSTSENSELSALDSQTNKSEITFIQADRQFTISTYILWRVLIEVVRQTSSATLMEETGLEEIMYHYLKNIDPYMVGNSIIHSSNWNLLIELIGHMSEKNFLSVSDRFIADLEKYPTGFTTDPQFNDYNLNLLIHGMRYLQMSNTSLERFEEGADFMKSLAKFFYKCENDNILNSYCDVINQLLLSLAGTLTAEVNHPTWVDAINLIYKKSLYITNNKPERFWRNAATLVATSLSVAPKELFQKKWLDTIDMNIKRFKPKSQTYEKVVITTSLSRLIWAYLYRYPDTLNAKTKNLENIANRLFQNTHTNGRDKRQHWITDDLLLIQSTVQILRSMAYSQLNFTLENIVLPLIKMSYNGSTLEGMSHERLSLAIKSYTCILSDYQSKERPPFPTDDVIHASLDPMEFSNINNKEIFDVNSSNAAVHEEVSEIFNSLLFLLDANVGCKTLESASPTQNSKGSTPLTPLSVSSGNLQFKFPGFSFHVEDNNQPKNLELFSTVISAASWCVSNKIAAYRKVIELLLRNCIHEYENIASFCVENLKILMTKKNPNVIITAFARTAFRLDEKGDSFLKYEHLISEEYIRLLEIYVELLQCWLDSLTETISVDTPSKSANDMYNVNHGFVQEEIHEAKTFEELDLKNIVTIIDEVEGNGLFFLFSHDFRVRYLGSQVLRTVVQFDEVIYDITTNDKDDQATTSDMSSVGNSTMGKKTHTRMLSKFAAEFGTRVIQVLESLDFAEIINPKKTILSEAEKKRLLRVQSKSRKDTIIRLAESNHGVDAALWFKVFEEVLDSLVRRCPIQIAMVRSYSCIRLVQLYDQIFEFSQNSASVGTSLVWDYMLYLKIACSSLTSTSEQKLHIPTLTSSPSLKGPGFVKSHSRKKSQQVFTVQHQKITSSKSIFKMTVPLLTTQNGKLKDAIVEGLSCLNVNIFKSFLESIEYLFDSWRSDVLNGKKSPVSDIRLRIEVTGILNKVSAKFAKSPNRFCDDQLLDKLKMILETVKTLLVRNSSQVNYEYQRLRKYYCGILESFHTEVIKVGDVERWIPFNTRKESFEFMEEWCGYGRFSSLSNQRYNAMTKDIMTKTDSIALQTTLELQRRQLQYSATSCMAALCSSKIAMHTKNYEGTPVFQSFDIPSVLSWIDSLLNTHNEKLNILARKALLEILSDNNESKEIVDEVIKKCYTTDPDLGNYFITLSTAIIKSGKFPYDAYRQLALALFSSGSDNFKVRTAAANLLEFTEMKFYNTDQCIKFVDGICSRSRVIYKRTMFQMSTHFATVHPEETYKMISELTMLFQNVTTSARGDILAVLLPWVQTVELDITPENPERTKSLMVLYNFFEITLKFSQKIQNEVETLWVALGSGNNGNNVQVIYDFIVTSSLERRNTIFFECARQIIVSLSTIPAGSKLTETLLANISPNGMLPSERRIPEDVISKDLPYIADLTNVIRRTGGNLTEASLSSCELSVIFLVDLLLVPSDIVNARLPLLLHIAFALLDHQLPLVQDQACAMLIHLIHQYTDTSAESTRKISDELRSADYQKKLWLHTDLIDRAGGANIPENMDTLVRNVLNVCESSIPNIQQNWSRTALQWATNCKVMHIATRSFQIFRCLITFLDQAMLRDMLSCLANTVSDENPGIQSFSMQILMTLNAITSELYSEQLIDFPQLFWSAVACLNTVHETEFIEVLSILSKFISKIDLDSDDTVQCLIATFPPNWEGRFDGLQSNVLIGLKSANAFPYSLKLLDRLNLLKDSQIIGSGDSRLLIAILFNLPRLLHAQTTKRFTEEVITAANVLCEMCDRAQITGLSRIITSLVKKRFRNKEDFLSQVVSVISRHFFPTYSAQALVFLLGLLFNKIDWVKVEVMDLLKHVFRTVNLQSQEFVGLGADLVSPLLRLLMTDYVDQALEVLDEAGSISASPFDKQYLMLSFGDSSARKEFSKIATLFGVPEDSGWSVPMPSLSTIRTRNNIHAVYSTCVLKPVYTENGENANDVQVVTEPEFKFNRDEYVQYNQEINNILIPVETRATELASVDDRDSLNHMLATLENLDSFFTKDSMDMQGYHHGDDSRDAESTTNSEHYMNFDSPALDQGPFQSTSSFRTLLAEGSPSEGSPKGSEHLSTPSTPGVSQRMYYRSSFKNNLGRRKSLGVIEAVPLIKDGSSKHDEHTNFGSLGSPLMPTSNGGEDDGMFKFDGFGRNSGNKVKKRPSRLSTPIVGGTVSSPRVTRPVSAGLTPRTPRTPRTPYGKTVFGRTNINKRASSRIYSPTRDTMDNKEE